METLRLPLAHLPAFLIGWSLVELAWPRRGPADAWMKLCLAPLLGWGATSSLYFFEILAKGPLDTLYPVFEWILALGLFCAALWKGRRQWKAAIYGFHPAGIHIRKLLPGFAVTAIFFVLCALLWIRCTAQPNGNYDAYAIWNLRARFLFLEPGENWREAFSPLLNWWSHADYPLLWPLVLLRGYISMGRPLTQAAVFQGWVFAAAIGGLWISGLARLRGAAQAAAGGLLLLGLPWVIDLSAFQQSDVPLAGYYLVFILLMLLNQKEPHSGYLWLGGLAAGCAAWTKNDGIVFLVAAILWAALDGLRPGVGRGLKKLALFGAGLALPLAAVLVFKIFLAPPGDLIGGQSAAEILRKILDPSRYLAISGAILNMLPTIGGLGWPLIVGLGCAFLLAGRASEQGPAERLFLPLALTLLGYCAVYLITPHPLEWHLRYSLSRLLFHLMIPALFLWLSLLRTPVELARMAQLGSKAPAAP